MILRRAEEGAVKCALRDLRRLLLTEVEYFYLGVSVRGNTTCLALERGRATAERARVLRHSRPERERSGPISKIVTWNYFTAESGHPGPADSRNNTTTAVGSPIPRARPHGHRRG